MRIQKYSQPRSGRVFLWVLAASFLGAALPSPTSADPCIVPEGPPGTVTLPPAGCEYLTADQVHMIMDGLPPGTTIELAAIHKDFICREQGLPAPACSIPLPECEDVGGSLGGNIDCFDSTAELDVTGTGTLAGFQRTLFVPLNVEVHTGPRNPGDPVQNFDTEMIRLEGQLFGDPDFDTLQIRAGSQFGLPSPGHTRLTDQGNGTYSVDSFFDIVYEIDFVGAPGSALEGFAGTTQGQIRMETGNPGVPIPVLSPMGLIGFGLLLVCATAVVIRRRGAMSQ